MTYEYKNKQHSRTLLSIVQHSTPSHPLPKMGVMIPGYPTVPSLCRTLRVDQWVSMVRQACTVDELSTSVEVRNWVFTVVVSTRGDVITGCTQHRYNDIRIYHDLMPFFTHEELAHIRTIVQNRKTDILSDL